MYNCTQTNDLTWEKSSAYLNYSIIAETLTHGIRHHYFPSYGMATHNNFHIKYAVRKIGYPHDQGSEV